MCAACAVCMATVCGYCTVLCGWYVVSVLYVQHVCLCVLYVCARNFFACPLRVLLLGSKPPGKPSKTWLEAAKKKVNDVARSRKIRTIRYEG